MDVRLQIFSAVISFIFLSFVINKVRHNRFTEKDSIFWVFGSLSALIISIFPKSLDVISRLLGINYPPALLFFLGLVFLFGMNFHLSRRVSQLALQNKELAQIICLLQLEQKQKEK